MLVKASVQRRALRARFTEVQPVIKNVSIQERVMPNKLVK